MIFLGKEIGEIELASFNKVECHFSGDLCHWYTPNSEKSNFYTKNSVMLRSSIWRAADNYPVSLGYKKFFNTGERSDLDPAPLEAIPTAYFAEKLDGSCLIISKYKHSLIIRTRGSLAQRAANYKELEELLRANGKIVDNGLLNSQQYSFLFEWLSPTHKIIIPYLTAELVLTNVVRHSDYSYLSQEEVRNIAESIGVRHTTSCTFSNNEALVAKLMSTEGMEGYCMYYQLDGEPRHSRIAKLKTGWYWTEFRSKKALSQRKVLLAYLDNDAPAQEELENLLVSSFEGEDPSYVKALVLNVYNAAEQLEKDKLEIAKQLKEIKTEGKTSTEIAKEIISMFKDDDLTLAFSIYSNRPLKRKKWKSLLEKRL